MIFIEKLYLVKKLYLSNSISSYFLASRSRTRVREFGRELSYKGDVMVRHTLGSFGNFGLEIQTWESTSALMSKSDNQLVEIWNSFGVYVEIIKKLSSLVDSHLVTHYIIKELAHFAKEMVTNKWKGNEMGINKWITKRKWESTSEIRIVVFFGFPNLDMMDRKSDNQTSSRTTRSARPWCGWKDFVRFSIHHTLKLNFRSVF